MHRQGSAVARMDWFGWGGAVFAAVVTAFCLVCGPAQGQLTATNQLIAYYDFEGNTLDKSGNGYNLVAGPLGGYDTVNKMVGASAANTGTAGSANLKRLINNMPLLQNATNALTLTGWFRPQHTTFLTSDRGIWYVSTPTHTDAMIYGYTRTSAGFNLSRAYSPTGSTHQVSAQNSANNEVWSFMGLTFDRGLLTSYNGRVSQANMATAQADFSEWLTALNRADQPDSNFYIGTRIEMHFIGQIDEVGVFNVALSPKQMKILFDGGKAGKSLAELVPELLPKGTIVIIR